MDSPGIDAINGILRVVDSLGTIGILVYMVYAERQRADSLMNHIVEDWKTHNIQNTVAQRNETR